MSDAPLRRYTDITALAYLLTNRQITLLDPQTWDDKNDSHYLRLYRKKCKLETVLALCFSRASERYQHWRMFANGPGGIRIRFNKDKLLEAVKRRHPGIRAHGVKYRRLDQMTSNRPSVKELPFLKRYAFKDEQEFRIIFESVRTKLPTLDIPIPLTSIQTITLSPWLPRALSRAQIDMLRSIRGCSALQIAHSSLTNNEQWKKLGESAE